MEITEISINDWKVFIETPIWKALLTELEERDKVLMELLRYGDKEWTDNEIRSRINELEYFKTLPSAIIVDMELTEQERKGDK